MMNNKGQFSIVAAMFVAVILVSSVMFTYSTIRYNSNQDQPQIMSAIDETNLALKQVLGFTVGYYGSILQVTGNTSYAYEQSSNYLNSGLANVAATNPQWGTSFRGSSLSLAINWFTNASYSEGDLNITYDLTGLGITGIGYSASCRLDVQVQPFSTQNQVHLTIIQDKSTPPVGLGITNFKFYSYQYSNLTWAMMNPPDEPLSSSNGTYTIDIPSGIDPRSFFIQIQDSRGIIVSASSFSHYTGSLTFNSTTVGDGTYVNQFNSRVDGLSDQGTHSNFTAQQQAPDGIFDTLTEQNTGSQVQDYFPNAYSTQGGASLVSGGLSNLNSDDYSYMTFQSYASAYSSNQYSTTTHDNSYSASTNGAGSVSWQHTTGSGNDRILLVSVDTFAYNSAPPTVTSVSYGSTSITSSFTALYSSNPQVRSYVFYLVNPSPGTSTVTVTFSSSTAATCGSTTYYNVNQTTPILASNTATNSGSSESISLSASGTSNKVLYGHLATQKSSNNYAVSDSAQQTNRWSKSASYSHSGTNYYCAGRSSDKSVTSGTVSLSWTSTQSVNWAAIAVLLQPTQLPTQETCQITLSGLSNTLNLNSLTWAIDASSSTTAGVTFQLFNYNLGQYPTSGDGYISGTLGTANSTQQQTITVNPTNYRDTLGRWQISIAASASVSSPFNVNLDLARYRTNATIYGASLEEQWTKLELFSACSTDIMH